MSVVEAPYNNGNNNQRKIMKEKSGTNHSYCPNPQNLPAEGMKVFQGLLHSHLLGDTLILRHGRNGQELPPIMKGDRSISLQVFFFIFSEFFFP